MRIALLPDTRPEAGLGHLRRCQALASVLERLGCMTHLCDFWQMWSGDVSAAVLDCYAVDATTVTEVQDAGYTIVHFDDGYIVHDNPADIVINGAPGAESLPYKLRDGAIALLGPQYLCLDPAIHQLRREDVAPEVRRVVVSLGANPPARVLKSVLQAVWECVPPRTEVLFSAGLQETDAVGAPFIPLTAKESQPFRATTLTALPPQTNIVKELSKADLAITGGGQTMLESVALGVPTIAVCMGENQRAQIRGCNGMILYGGSAKDEGLGYSVGQAVRQMVHSVECRRLLSENGRRLIDGKGAERVAKAIVERVQKSR